MKVIQLVKYHSRNFWKLPIKEAYQKQPSRGVLKERCSESMQQTDWRTPMPKCDLQRNFMEITHQHGCSPVNLLHFFRTSFYKDKSGGLFLAYLGVNKLTVLSLKYSFALEIQPELKVCKAFIWLSEHHLKVLHTFNLGCVSSG